ncbi:putative DNA repair protein RecN [Hyphomonas polymorpha PS728]|uniref:DNA repair protein RecN n=1 Tax=Hyphomonas polymorpha PS728 TaxID=1280954 RepID=A0A062V7L2_9PROT|nr:DNA repair protein RecN [Hyphomonas polymorpha]KCZ98112.1 putative DNA repair protein RecN [Hyphomonas polymorpha PS728]
MLLSVSIRDFVLISRLDLSPGEGFTALTGETGAGKSIILDAIALALGGPADRGVIRAGAAQASVAAEFDVARDHPVWTLLAGQGVGAEAGETLTLKRVVRAQGPARGFINDQPVSASLLAEAGDLLVEIHGQHAASSLMRPSSHRRLLDQFAGNEALLAECAAAWQALDAARAERARLKAEQDAAREAREWLVASVEELERLAPQKGEAERLSEERMRLMQAERIQEAVAEAEEALAKGGSETALGKAARAAERICRLPGFESGEGQLAETARAAAEAIERALIEVREAELAVARLAALPEASGDLDAVEARLFALRAAARKYGGEAELLPGRLEALRGRLDLVEAGDAGLKKAEAAESAARARWHGAAHRLTQARKGAAGRLEAAIAAELKPLKLGRATIRVALTPLAEAEAGAAGAERVEFEAETNPGAGFGALRKVASGGELARVSLALKCALAEAGSAGTLIFDEADQGVGGAVAAAIGERFEHLARTRQVFAVTHSPQVAAAADNHWLIEKLPEAGETQLSLLDACGRREEIARMLSGAEITDEARAAAGRLMEDA